MKDKYSIALKLLGEECDKKGYPTRLKRRGTGRKPRTIKQLKTPYNPFGSI